MLYIHTCTAEGADEKHLKNYATYKTTNPKNYNCVIKLDLIIFISVLSFLAAAPILMEKIMPMSLLFVYKVLYDLIFC